MQMPEGIKALDVNCREGLSIVRVEKRFLDISIWNSIHQFVIAGITQGLETDLEIAVKFVTY